ncbi:UNVERIFIED_CONTAM: hypothetical protein FKN15_003347 [Acipenser sinensis]
MCWGLPKLRFRGNREIEGLLRNSPLLGGNAYRTGINIFLDGYVPTENLRFRETSLVFKVAETANEEEITKMCRYQYPRMKKQMGDFELEIIEGEFTDSEIMVMLGENGTGKTTFIRMLAGRLKPDEGGEVPVLNVSYKPQKISPKFKGSVRQLLHEKIRDAYTHPQFVTDVMKPLQIENIIDQDDVEQKKSGNYFFLDD